MCENNKEATSDGNEKENVIGCIGAESNTLVLTSPIPPSVNHYLSYRTLMKAGKPLSISYKTKEAKAYQAAFSKYVSVEAEKQHWSFLPEDKRHIYVDAIFYFPRVDMDCNNFWKVMLDAITDTHRVWLDDNIVCERVQRIYYDSENPRVELVVSKVDYIGVFRSTEEYLAFKLRCEECSRFKRNCSILRAAVNGQIQEEITNCTCNKFKLNKKRGIQDG